MSAIAILVMLVLNFHQLNGASMHDHGGSLNQRQRRVVSNAADAQASVDAHNRQRSLEANTAPASNMEAMVWSSDMANLANSWAVQCKWSHDPSISTMSPPVGQNLYTISGASLNVTAAIEAWYNEKPYYDYNTQQCQSGPGIMCGHYTQVVWSSSIEVGCAAVFCPTLTNNTMKNATIYACDYRPAGNYENTKPYTKGPVCTQCASGKMWCSNGLCNGSCTAAGPSCSCQTNSCNNQGTFDPSKCACSCNPGWTGTDCSCNSNYCNGHGTLNAGTCTCTCDYGWSGVDCSKNHSPRNHATKAVLVFVLGVNVFVVHDFL